MKTTIDKATAEPKKTYIVDAEGKILGRLATKIATVLIGKGKPTFSYDQLSGDQVIVINADKIRVSGTKTESKMYKHYTGWPGGLRTYNFESLMEKKPEDIITRAVKRMLPKNHLGRKMIKQLFVFAGAEHKHQAQQPVALEV